MVCLGALLDYCVGLLRRVYIGGAHKQYFHRGCVPVGTTGVLGNVWHASGSQGHKMNDGTQLSLSIVSDWSRPILDVLRAPDTGSSHPQNATHNTKGSKK